MDLREALKELADEITAEVKRRMESDVGVNRKVGRNTLIGSDLYNSVKTEVKSDNELVFQIADYYTYVVGGWTKSGKGKGTWKDFVENIEKWMSKKGIVGDANDIVWAIYHRAQKMHYGIDPRPFIGNGYLNEDPAAILPFLDDFFTKWADEVFEEITKEIDKKFK